MIFVSYERFMNYFQLYYEIYDFALFSEDIFNTRIVDG